jgi:hypothetical protein
MASVLPVSGHSPSGTNLQRPSCPSTASLGKSLEAVGVHRLRPCRNDGLLTSSGGSGSGRLCGIVGRCGLGQRSGPPEAWRSPEKPRGLQRGLAPTWKDIGTVCKSSIRLRRYSRPSVEKDQPYLARGWEFDQCVAPALQGALTAIRECRHRKLPRQVARNLVALEKAIREYRNQVESQLV